MLVSFVAFLQRQQVVRFQGCLRGSTSSVEGGGADFSILMPYNGI